MLEAQGNLWTQEADAFVVTTNGVLSTWNPPTAVMGAGIALEAKRMFPGIDRVLGQLISVESNRAFNLGRWGLDLNVRVVSMPTKYHFLDKSDLDLIATSARQLVEMADKFGWQRIVLPRAGCGVKTGGLRWEDVGPVLAGILDDRFTVVSL